MKLFFVTPNKKLPVGYPWIPGMDKGAIVRATNEKRARELISMKDQCEDTKAAWLDRTLADCTQIREDGEEGVLIEGEIINE